MDLLTSHSLKVYVSGASPSNVLLDTLITTKKGLVRVVLSATAAITLLDRSTSSNTVTLAANTRHVFDVRTITDLAITCSAVVSIEAYYANP